MIVYPNGVIGTTDLGHQVIQPSQIVQPIKQQGLKNTRTSASRNSYLGYSAGKATYGRYYAKNNNQEQQLVQNFDGSYVLQDPSGVLYKTAGGQYVQASPFLQQPVVNRNQSVSEQVLEQTCAQRMWGIPSYQLMTSPGPDNRPMFFFRVSVPALAQIYPHQPYFQVTVCSKFFKLTLLLHILTALDLRVIKIKRRFLLFSKVCFSSS